LDVLNGPISNSIYLIISGFISQNEKSVTFIKQNNDGDILFHKMFPGLSGQRSNAIDSIESSIYSISELNYELIMTQLTTFDGSIVRRYSLPLRNYMGNFEMLDNAIMMSLDDSTLFIFIKNFHKLDANCSINTNKLKSLM